jgi:predicted nucleic acid-binding protein
VTTLVIDASIAIKWVVEEDGTPQALAVRAQGRLLAPDLLVAECANVLWRKVSRGELSREQALLAARLLEASDIDLRPTRTLLATAARLAIDLDHPAYDCLYLALAIANDCRLVTADERFLRKLAQLPGGEWRDRAVSLAKIGAEPRAPKRR